jgi:hypothetical protein
MVAKASLNQTSGEAFGPGCVTACFRHLLVSQPSLALRNSVAELRRERDLARADSQCEHSHSDPGRNAEAPVVERGSPVAPGQVILRSLGGMKCAHLRQLSSLS